MGNDLTGLISLDNRSQFQSTFPRGERQFSRIKSGLVFGYFNPRSRVGNDTSILSLSASNHQFQSTFPRGERQCVCQSRQFAEKFQSTFPRGERLLAFILFHQYQEFQSTFPRGERLIYPRFICNFIYISIHVPAWGTTQ